MASLACAGCGAAFDCTHRRRRFCSRACANQSTGPALSAKARDASPRPIVWSCGGGVDSVAIAVLICQGKLPKPSYSIMIDVGYEPQTTWDYADRVLRPRLREAGVDLTILRTVDWADHELIKQDHLVIPAFRRNDDGTVTKLHTHCSGTWKAKVAKRWLRSQGVTRCEQWIGIAVDEGRRAVPEGVAWIRTRWPLIELGLTRADCLYLIGQAGWPQPERTSCYICPHRSEGDWRRLVMRSPQDFARAVEVEATIQETHPGLYLHRSCRPLALAINACPPVMDEAQRQSCARSFAACV